MKTVYIAHPVGDNVKSNIRKILNIVRHINLTEPNIVPFAPYIVDVQALEDSNTEERKRGFENNKHYFDNGFIDEVWLFGSHISKGMAIEIEWAKSLGIKVVSKSEGTEV